MRAARCSGASAVTGIIVVQLGHDAMPFGIVREVLGVHLGDHERHVGVHAERGGVVDDDRAGGGGARRPLGRERIVDVDDHEVEAVEAAVAQHLARDLAAAERELAAFGPRRRVRAQLGDGELPLVEDAQHLGAHHAGRTHDPDPLAHRPHPGLARLTRRTLVEPERGVQRPHGPLDVVFGTTHEMRIVDVLIISMLMPSAASISNIFAATPGCVFIPGADQRDAADSLVGAEADRLGLDDDLVHRGSRAGDVVARERERDVGVARGRDVLHDHVDVDADASASVRNTLAATPGRSGTCSIVIFASETSCVTPEMIACSIDWPSSVTHVPGAQVKLERTWTRHAVVARELDRPQREHTAAGGSHLEHLVERDVRELARRRDDARVGGVDAFDVGVDLAHVGAERGGERDRGGIRPAPTRRGDVAGRRHTLEAGDDRDPALRRAPRGCGPPAPRGSWPCRGRCR